MRTYLATIFAVGLLAAPASTTIAQDSVLAELYGAGVHAYFSGEYEQAHEYLTTAIEQGSRDPRALYFRGLSYARLGRPDEAKSDYAKAAEMETAGADRVYPVARSLQRVQGRLRMDLERERQSARLAARIRDVKAAQVRYEQLQNAEDQVLRNNPNRVAPATAQELVGPPPAADQTDPFADGAAAPEPEPEPVAATSEPAAADAGGDLFGDSQPMPEVSNNDPFGGGGADPFGSDAGAADASSDPFADDPAGAMPAEPADDPADDPFGSDPFN